MAKVLFHQLNKKDQRMQRNIHRFQLYKSISITSAIITVYFTFSIGLTFYQRWFLQKFRFPLTVVGFHLILKFIFAAAIRWGLHICSRKPTIVVKWMDSITKLAPAGFAGGLDIAFSNWGLEFITVSLYTMTKSTSIIFLLCFALLLKLEKKTWGIFLIVFMISGGLMLFTYKSTQFNKEGFLLVLFASFSSGLRWTLSQFLMQRSSLGLQNPIDMIYYIQPWMIIAVFPFSVIFEGDNLKQILSTTEVWNTFCLVAAGAVIAFLLELTEFLVVNKTSSLTLSVSSIFKDIFALFIGSWNGDIMTWINVLGLTCCLCGITGHVILKARNMNYNYQDLVADESSALFLPFEFGTSDEDTKEETDDNDESSSEEIFSMIQNRDWPSR